MPCSSADWLPLRGKMLSRFSSCVLAGLSGSEPSSRCSILGVSAQRTRLTNLDNFREGHREGVLRLIVGASSVPGTDAQLTTLYLLAEARGHGLGAKALAFAREEASR